MIPEQPNIYAVPLISKSIGGYRIHPSSDNGNVIFSVPRKPNWFNRMMVKLILGWEWVDSEDTYSEF